jgi:hypothetical protein
MCPERYEIEPVMHVFGWDGEASELDNRLNSLRNHIQEVGAKAVIGVSADASAGAIVVVSESQDLACVNVCGRLHEAGNNIYKFEKYRTRAPIFTESVSRAEVTLNLLDREKSLIFWARFDETVPEQAATVNGIPAEIAPLPPIVWVYIQPCVFIVQ